MQVSSVPNAASRFDRIVAREVPGGRGLKAWDALLRAHATLLRQLETDLESKTGLALADFDVLAQLAIAGGSLRMTELADRSYLAAVLGPSRDLIAASNVANPPCHDHGVNR